MRFTIKQIIIAFILLFSIGAYAGVKFKSDMALYEHIFEEKQKQENNRRLACVTQNGNRVKKYKHCLEVCPYNKAEKCNCALPQIVNCP